MANQDLIDQIDLTDLDVFVERLPHDWFDALRSEHPVWLHPETEEEEPFWVVTSYEHITEIHRSGTLFSHQTGPGRDGAGGIALPDLPADQGPGLQMVMTDPPKHTSYRKLVNSGFTPRMIRKLEDTMRMRTDIILDRVTPVGSCDFVTDIAAELPLMAIADIVGVPEQDREKLFDWSNRIMGSQDPEFADADRDPDDDQYVTAMIEMAMYAHGLADDKRSSPGEDIWTQLVDAQVTLEDGTTATLTDIERDLFFTLLIVAGNETTRNGISLGMVAFLEHPDQWQLLQDDPDLIDGAVDEILRYCSPVNYFRRTATNDAVVGGASIKAGDKVTLWYPAGNRDPLVYDDPHRFDITRTNNHHMAFGAGGAHYCLGANLAKLELKVMFSALAERVPDIAITGPIERLRMNLVNSLKHLPVSFTPSPRRL